MDRHIISRAKINTAALQHCSALQFGAFRTIDAPKIAGGILWGVLQFFYYSYNRRLHYFSEHHVKTNALFLKFAEEGVLLGLEQEL